MTTTKTDRPGGWLLLLGAALGLVAAGGCGCHSTTTRRRRRNPSLATTNVNNNWRCCEGARGADGRVFYQVSAATYACNAPEGCEARVVRVWYPADRPERGCTVAPRDVASDDERDNLVLWWWLSLCAIMLGVVMLLRAAAAR